MRESLPPRERIRKKKEFLVIYKKGKRYRNRYFSLIYLSNSLAFSRVGVVASSKVGNAVIRSKVKRWMRELFRRNKDLLGFPVDLIIVATPEIRRATWAELEEHYLSSAGKVLAKKRDQ